MTPDADAVVRTSRHIEHDTPGSTPADGAGITTAVAVPWSIVFAGLYAAGVLALLVCLIGGQFSQIQRAVM